MSRTTYPGYPTSTPVVPPVTHTHFPVYYYLIVHVVMDIVFLEFWVVDELCSGVAFMRGVCSVVCLDLFVCLGGCSVVGGVGGACETFLRKAARAICVLQIARTRA